jgi:hypothetical protein
VIEDLLVLDSGHRADCDRKRHDALNARGLSSNAAKIFGMAVLMPRRPDLASAG